MIADEKGSRRPQVFILKTRIDIFVCSFYWWNTLNNGKL